MDYAEAMMEPSVLTLFVVCAETAAILVLAAYVTDLVLDRTELRAALTAARARADDAADELRLMKAVHSEVARNEKLNAAARARERIHRISGN